MLLRNVKRILSTASAAGLLLGAADVMAEYGLNLRPGVTSVSQEAYSLHMLIFWVCVCIAIVVFGVMFISILKHRKSKGAVPAQFHESTTVEILWTIVPFLILIGMAIPATTALIALEDTSDSELSIKVTGYQWKWQYEYLDEGVSFFSTLSTPKNQIMNQVDKGADYLLEVDNPVVVPVGKKVRFLITANDVIHAWWVPDLGVKKDAIPGYINEIWARIDKPGVYRGQCAELCGKDHGFMPIVVVAKSEADYEKWVADQKSSGEAAAAANDREWSRADLMAHGEKVYGTNCAACHQANGAGVPGTFPALAGGVIATGPIAGHIDLVLNGKAGTAMAAFGAQLSDADLAAVITYERNSWGNDTGDVLQPSDIKAAR